MKTILFLIAICIGIYFVYDNYQGSSGVQVEYEEEEIIITVGKRMLIAEETNEKNRIIDLELERTNQKLLELIEHYGDKIENLKKICSSFDEKILLYGEKIIYLDFERFVHIFSRHVTETKIGDKSKIKTVFQYKFDSIMQLTIFNGQWSTINCQWSIILHPVPCILLLFFSIHNPLS